MKIEYFKKIAMPARLGEIEGIVPSMPVSLCDSAKEENPQFNCKKMERMIKRDNFLSFIFSSLGSNENALRDIFSTFILEDEHYCKRYKEG